MNLRLPVILLGAFLLPAFSVNAQSGCTDPAATNYNASATINDGSCVYPVTHCTPAYRADLNSIIDETSGLIWTDNKLWTHNDSGHPAELYHIDTTTGATLQTVVIDNYPNTDWESISADSNYIYVGDMGNNSGDRRDLKILKIKKTDIGTAATVHVNAQAISFSYTDQTSFTSSSTHNFDCESMISISDSLYIFTKDRGDGQTRVYKLPKTPGTYAISPYTSYNVGGLITDASYDVATKEITLIGYLSGHTNSFLWFLNDYQGVDFFSGNKRRIEIGNSTDEWQTEGITHINSNRLFISNEAAGVHNQSIYTMSRSAFAPTSVNDYTNNTPLSIYPSPVAGLLHIDNVGVGATYLVTNILGQSISSGTFTKTDNTIYFNEMEAGTYIIDITQADGRKTIAKFLKQ